MKRSTRFAVGGVALGVGGAIFAGPLYLSSPQAASAQVAAMQKATFRIANMTCALCPVTVKKAMEHVPGVKSVTVDFKTKTATVVFDPSKASMAAIAAASTNAGYPARALGS